MKRRLFALALALLLAVSLPVSALAATWYLENGDITIRATEDGQYVSQGDKQDVKDDDTIISQKDSSTSTDRVIKVIAEKDATANVTLDGVNINTDANRRSDTAFRTEGEGDVNIELDGSNTLRTGYFSYAAGLNKGNSGTLTINDEDTNGTLEATGGYGGAGIGGGRDSSTSDITITGGTITANGSFGGAGIGGGHHGSGSNITITGGDVTANGSGYASGIGGSLYGSGSDITISGGKVKATGGEAASGIGGGNQGHGSNIEISGGEVEATGGALGAGIGGVNGRNGSDINISGGKVTAKGGMSGAGIGGGCRGTGSSITISGDAQVKAQGGTEHNKYKEGAGAGIGNGGTSFEDEDENDILVDGAEVEPDTSGLTENGRLEYYAPGADIEKDAPEKVIENKPEPGAPAPVYHVTDKDGNQISYTAAREGGVLTIRVDAAYAQLTLLAPQMLTAQGVETVVFVTSGATSAFSPAALTAYAAEAPFVLTHDGEAVTFTAGETDLASLLIQA